MPTLKKSFWILERYEIQVQAQLMHAINTFIYLEKSSYVVHFWSTKWVSDYPKLPSLKDTSKTVEKQEKGRITLVIKDLQVSF